MRHVGPLRERGSLRCIKLNTEFEIPYLNIKFQLLCLNMGSEISCLNTEFQIPCSSLHTGFKFLGKGTKAMNNSTEQRQRQRPTAAVAAGYGSV